MLHPDDYRNVKKVIAEQQSLATNGIDLVDYRFIRKDGEVGKAKDMGYCAFNGEKNQYYVFITDVTDVEELYNSEQVKIEDILKENGLSMKELSSSDQGVYVADATRRIIFWNKSAERITGYKQAEVNDLNCFHTALKHKNKKDQYMCNGLCPLMKAILEGETFSEELSAYCSDGRRKMLTVRTDPIYKDGKIFGAIPLLLNINFPRDCVTTLTF